SWCRCKALGFPSSTGTHKPLSPTFLKPRNRTIRKPRIASTARSSFLRAWRSPCSRLPGRPRTDDRRLPVCATPALFLAVVGEVVFEKPGLAVVIRTAAELPHGIGPQPDELQVPLQFFAVGLRDRIRPVVHHPVFQPTVEEDIARNVVDPELLPALQRRI